MKKTLQDLTIKDNFMFGAVMTDPENCKGLLELLLHKKLDRIIVSTEKSMIYHPEYKGVRLDVYAKDDTNTRYNIEMQVLRKSTLGKRSRYYHSQIDMDLLLSGSDYRKLPDTYVIFICDFDPFGFGKYLYSFYTACREEGSLAFNDGLYTIFLSTAGKNESEVPEALVSFLKFVKADLSESSKDFHNEYVRKLQRSISQIKENREMEERFMLLEELLLEEHEEGMRKGIEKGRTEERSENLKRLTSLLLSLLQKFDMLPNDLLQKIESMDDPERFMQWIQFAAESASLPDFLSKID